MKEWSAKYIQTDILHCTIQEAYPILQVIVNCVNEKVIATISTS